MEFRPHGNYRFFEDAQILILKAEEEAWNLETSLAVSGRMCSFAESMKSQAKTFGFIADTQRIEGITSDSIEVWHSVFSGWYDCGHRAFARVGSPDSMNYQVYHREFDEHFKKTIKFIHVPTIEEAIGWMHENGFQGFEGKQYL